MGKVKASLNEEGCINCDLLYDEREPLATDKLCSTCVREGLTNFVSKELKENKVSNHETETYLEDKFQEALDKGMSDSEAEKYAREEPMRPYGAIRKTMTEMTNKAMNKSAFNEYDRGYRDGVMQSLELLVNNISKEGESNAS
jgi:hypothetical protein|tara:strand:- start:76 stop:504 length:429 start_codon:yes stop_codon:yes gene_type:complete